MPDEIPVDVRENFGYVTMILYHLEEIFLNNETIEKTLEEHPRFGLGFNIAIRKKAYTALKWIVGHPDTDFTQLDSWHVNDNQAYFIKMKKLYDIMTKYKFYEKREA